MKRADALLMAAVCDLMLPFDYLLSVVNICGLNALVGRRRAGIAGPALTHAQVRPGVIEGEATGCLVHLD